MKALFLILVFSFYSVAADYPITVRGASEASFQPPPIASQLEKEDRKYDVVVVGGGLAGLTASLYLSDQGKKVLLLEKEPELGGLAFGGAAQGVRFDRGAAYWTNAYEEEMKILEHIGIADFEKRYPIAEPIDSYLWKGVLYKGIWEEETLEKLPPSFALFKAELQRALKEDRVPNQPIEEADHLELDRLSAREWIQKMPRTVSRLLSRQSERIDEEEKEIFEHFRKNRTRTNPMGDVIDMLDLYCRSALGSTTDKISALAFANFYSSEIETRFTTETGTGKAAELIVKKLRARPEQVTIRTSATVQQMESTGKGVFVRYLKNGKRVESYANFAVYAAQLNFAPKLISGLAAETERVAAISSIDYSHYSVHIVFVKGHPYRATYDTWTRAADYTPDDFTDVILGRWMDPKIDGYQKYRDFSKEPPDDKGILSIYHPLSPRWIGSGYTNKQAIDIAEKAVERMLELYNPLLKTNWGTQIEVKSVETNRWPFSVHVPAPGHFTKKAKILRRPFGKIYFAHSNLGTPAFEEALFRGHCAAVNILVQQQPPVPKEDWSQCPLEKNVRQQ